MFLVMAAGPGGAREGGGCGWSCGDDDKEDDNNESKFKAFASEIRVWFCG